MLNVSDRTFRRYLAKYEEEGLDGLIDKRLHQLSHRRAPVDEVISLASLYRHHYSRWNIKLNQISLLLKNKFHAKLKHGVKEHFIDTQNRAAYIINDNSKQFGDRNQQLTERFGVETITQIYINETGQIEADLYCQKQIPFIDASHHLQTHPNDMNCVIYRNNFLAAAAKMLSNPIFSERIYQLGEKVAKNDDEAKKTLSTIFQHDLKIYLPCYYNENSELKPYEEINQYHLKRRWDLGSEALPEICSDLSLRRFSMP